MHFRQSLLLASLPTAALSVSGLHKSRCGVGLVARSAANLDPNLAFQTNVNSTTPIAVDLYVHVVAESNTSRAYLPRATLDEQLAVLSSSFEPARISFNLRNMTWTVNPTWVNHTKGGYGPMMAALHQGGNDVLNIYVVDDPAFVGLPQFANEKDVDERLLGFASDPLTAVDGDTAYNNNHCFINAGSTPGGYKEGTNLGKTAVHEVGHWFGLEHTFEGGCNADPTLGDGVADTPASANSTDGCPTMRDSCPDIPGLDPIHNYMDYSDDECLTEFTPGQIMRMHAMWNTYRKPAGSSPGPNPTQQNIPSPTATPKPGSASSLLPTIQYWTALVILISLVA